MEATITPKYVNEPRGNSRYWSIKDANGEYWSCTKEVAQYAKDMQQQGAALVVTYEEKDYNGKTYKNIKSAAASSQPAARPAQQSGGDSKSEDIFVCGVVNHAIAHQSYPLDVRSLAILAMNARLAWRQSNGQVSAQTTGAAMRNPDPNDELPPFA